MAKNDDAKEYILFILAAESGASINQIADRTADKFGVSISSAKRWTREAKKNNSKPKPESVALFTSMMPDNSEMHKQPPPPGKATNPKPKPKNYTQELVRPDNLDEVMTGEIDLYAVIRSKLIYIMNNGEYNKDILTASAQLIKLEGLATDEAIKERNGTQADKPSMAEIAASMNSLLLGISEDDAAAFMKNEQA